MPYVVSQMRPRVTPAPGGESLASDDAALVRAFAVPASQRRAAAAIFTRYAPLVHRIIKRSLGLRYDVQDVLQEVFIRVFRRLHTLKEAEALRPFIIGVTVNVIRWQLRRQTFRRLVRLVPDPANAAPPDPWRSEVEQRYALLRFEAALGRLGAPDRILFTLRYLEGFTLVECARSLDVSLATAKRRLERVREILSVEVGQDARLAACIVDGKVTPE